MKPRSRIANNPTMKSRSPNRITKNNNHQAESNNLLLNDINMITLAATTLTGVAAASGVVGAQLLALKLSSTLLFSAATYVESSMEKVLALDKAYPLPLLGAMLEKFPSKYEPAVWWPQKRREGNAAERKMKRNSNSSSNGWSEELEMGLREVIEVMKRKDLEDYDRLGNIALKINKSLAIAGPLLTGVATIGSTFVGSDDGLLSAMVPLVAGSMACAINGFEHGGQVGMVFEMYRNCGGIFRMLGESVESTVEENDLEKRENGEIFEMMLGRSVLELRQVVSKFASSCMDEFASKLFLR
ncbi:hypothetical protein KIW84_040160 [Lathyrus oleraceus]|uniref:F-box protein n=1 Tax=Pisum sativum TaxID=3888 RepID=A0A9D5AJQ9_PEA|nr:hypothetical protein KIW84_040160 [Pisum sativum]